MLESIVGKVHPAGQIYHIHAGSLEYNSQAIILMNNIIITIKTSTVMLNIFFLSVTFVNWWSNETLQKINQTKLWKWI